MTRSYRSLVRNFALLVFGAASVLVVPACSPPVERPKGAAADFENAKDMFKRGRFDRVLEFTDGQVTPSPANNFTDRARVLRAVVFIGRIKGYKSLAEAYTEGVDKTKDPHHKGAYGQQRHDNLVLGAKSALGLAEVAQQLSQGGTFPKELSLEAPYPTTEGPMEVKDLLRVTEGGWIEPEQQDATLVEAVNKGIDDALADVVGGDRSKARSVMAAGPVKLDGVDFATYVVHGLLDGASLFDRKHMHDPEKARTVANIADGVAKAAQALLKETPNKEKEQGIKKLQDQIKATLKTA